MRIQAERAAPYDALTLAIYGLLLVCALLQGAFGAMMPFIRADLPMSHSVESLHITAMAVGGVLFSVVSEPVRLRFGRTVNVIAVAVVGALGSAGLALASAPAMSILSMVLVGAGMIGALVIGQGLLVGLHGPRAPRMIGEFNVVYGVGAALAAAVFPVVVATFLGWRGYVGIHVGLLVVLVLPFLVRATGRVDGNQTATPTAVLGPRLRRPRLMYVVMPLAVVVEWSFLFWTATHLFDVADLSKQTAASSVASLWFMFVVGRAVGSWAVPRFGGHRVLASSLLLTIVAFGALNLVNSALEGTIAAAIAGLAVSNVYPSCVALLVGSDPVRADSALARATLIIGAATIVSPFALGALADALGLGPAFYAVPLVAILSIATLVLAGPRWTGSFRPALEPLER